MNERTTCRWAGSTSPRLLRSHEAGCEVPGCDGCQPCPERHCRLCGREHVTSDGRGTDETCATCLAAVREDLGLCLSLSTRMLGEAIVRGLNSDAAVYAGPVADPDIYERRWRLIQEAARFLPSTSDQAKAEAAWADDNRDEPHPTWVVGTWEMLVREFLDQPSEEPITLTKACGYLDGHLSRLAHDVEFGFEDLARELRTCRGRLEDLLSEGERDERGAPCPTCNRANLVKSYGDTESDDRWTCPKCHQWWTERDYRAKVDGAYLLYADALTARQMREAYRVPEGSTRAWAAKGRVAKRGRDDQGRTLYDVRQTLTMRDGRAS